MSQAAKQRASEGRKRLRPPSVPPPLYADCVAVLGKGITNKQASYLAALQREAREPYSGSGMTRQQASREIDRLERQLGVGRHRQERELAHAS